MLQQVQITPTQRAAIDRRKAFHATISEKAEARKPKPQVIPITQAEPVVQPIKLNVIWSPSFGWPEYRVNMGFAPESKKRRTTQEIIAATAAYFEMSKDELMSDRRHHFLVMPRHVAMYLAHVHTMSSTTAIGRALGGRDHTTIIHGIRNIQSRVLFNDEEIIRALDTIADMLSIKL